jgi:hypothetical protein
MDKRIHRRPQHQLPQQERTFQQAQAKAYILPIDRRCCKVTTLSLVLLLSSEPSPRQAAFHQSPSSNGCSARITPASVGRTQGGTV